MTVAALIPADPQFAHLAGQVSELLTATGDLLNESDREKLATRVEALRAHISETYRLHRRMIRHRRSQVLKADDELTTMPFELTGRQAPEMILLDSPGQELTQDGLLQWQSQVTNWLIDNGAEDQSAAYGRILAVLTSRADGVSQDLADALRWRLGGDTATATRTGLTKEERLILRSPQIMPTEAGVLRPPHWPVRGRRTDQCPGRGAAPGVQEAPPHRGVLRTGSTSRQPDRLLAP